nr:nucleolar complex protein 4 homolog B-like [Dermatophagoides farinae]
MDLKMNESKSLNLIPLQEFNKITSDILQDRKNVNRIIDLIDILSNLDEIQASNLYAESLIRCLSKIWTNYIDSREMVLLKDDDTDQYSKINKFKSWLITLYESTISLFIRILENKESNYSLKLRQLCLELLMKFVEEEGKFPYRYATNNDEISFPVVLLEKIVRSLISELTYNQELIAFYSKYQYDDVIHFTMTILHKIIDENKGNDKQNLMFNIIDMLSPIRLITPEDLLPKSLQSEFRKVNKSNNDRKTLIRLCELHRIDDSDDSGNHIAKWIQLPTRKFKFNYSRDAEIYSSLWIKYFTFQLPPQVFKKSLLYLDKYAIRHFENPLLLADFLINSFQTGGIISILSLSPLYTLIHKCNLEYPNFYGQLYSLLEPAITYVKHRPRFLFWCDLFLTSTHISATIVASFAKKFARLTIISSPDTILILLPFIGNLFIRHPMIKRMLDYKQIEPEQDPFLDQEQDPEKTQALNSYMWELNLLQSHYHPEIVLLSKQISSELPRYEWNMEDILETSMDDVIDKTKTSLNDQKKFSYDLDCSLYYDL